MEQQQSVFDSIRKSIAERIASRPTKPKSVAVPKDRWPLWAVSFKHLSTPEDKGIGDVIARMIGDEKSEAFKAWHMATFGTPCNCAARRELWNRLYPLL